MANSKGWDQARRPQHYAGLGIETKDVIEAWDLWEHHYKACIIKYASRAGHKSPTGEYVEEFNPEYAEADFRKIQAYTEMYLKALRERML